MGLILGYMGNVPLHCRRATCPSTPLLTWWGSNLAVQSWMAPGHCGCHRLHAMLGFVAVGMATKQPWGWAVRHLGAQPPCILRFTIPCAVGWHCPGVVPSPPPPRASAWRASQKEPVPVGDGGRGLDPPLAPCPCHLWAPTLQPPTPCTALSLSG